MQGIIKPSPIAVTQESIPSFLREQNPNLVAFLDYYYQWMAQDGNALDLLENQIEYADVTKTTPTMLSLFTSELLKFIPASSNVNRSLIANNIKDFYKAKGTLPSYDFIMNILFNDTATIQWNTDKVFRPSTNSSIRNGQISVYSDSAWNSQAIGSMMTQVIPSEASLIIEDVVSTTVNGKNVNIIQINPESVVGDFVVGSDIRALDRTVNRAWTYIDVYYIPVSNIINNPDIFDLDTYPDLTVTIANEVSRQYVGLVVLQVGSNFRAIVESLDNRSNFDNKWVLTFSLKNLSGSFSTGDIYLVSEAIELTHYNKGHFVTGTVAPSIVDINLINSGALYTTGEVIEYVGGTGTEFKARVNEIGGGSVENIIVVNSGYGYSVGDKLNADSVASYGAGLNAVVSTIDGIGASITSLMELDSFQIRNGGHSYAVGDVITFSDGESAINDYPTTLTVSSISTSLVLNEIDVITGGFGYNYANLKLLDLTSNALVSNFTANATIDAGVIQTINITQYPTITHTNTILLINGYGATATATVSSGVITGISFTGGWNYTNPQIQIVSALHPITQAQFSFTTNANGTITGISINNGGSNYSPSISLAIVEKWGLNATTNVIINNPTTGPVTGLSTTHRGVYSSLPNCFDVAYLTNSAAGVGLILDAKYKFKSVSLVDPGSHFKQTVIDTTTSLGDGISLYPVLAAGVITAITTTAGTGTAYTYAKAYINGTGYGFSGVANIVAGRVTSITIKDGGIGYTTGDTVSIVGDGTGSTATLTVSNGVVRQMEVLNGGQNYAYDAAVTYVMDPIDYPTATSTASTIAGTALTIGGTVTGIWTIGMLLGGVGIQAGTYIVSGTYPNFVVNNTQTISSEVINSNIPAVFNTVIDNGTVKRVDVVSGGNGYVEVTNDLKMETGDYLLVDTGIKLAYETPYGIPKMLDGTPAIITVDIAGNGGVQNAIVVAGGTGYYSSSEIVPLKVSLNSINGFGAVIVPVLELGQFVSLNILHSGQGYSLTDTITVTGGGGTSANLKPIFSNGKLVEIIIINPGSSYKYGTNAVVTGDGSDAQLSCVVNTSITEIVPLIHGSGYASTTSLTITDVTGSGAVTKVILDANGGIESVLIISGGNGYTNPQISIVNAGAGAGASLHPIVPRFIESVVVTDTGENYSTADVFIYGDGTNAVVSVSLEHNGSIANPVLIYSGSGYVINPVLKINDISNYGAVTSVDILDGGSLYTIPPLLSLPIKYNGNTVVAEGAEFVCYGEAIGHIRDVSFTEFGTGWEESPNFLFPVHCIMQENSNFIVGETISIQAYPYIQTDALFDLLLEDGSYIIIELKLKPLSAENGESLLTEEGLHIYGEDTGDIEQEFFEIFDANGNSLGPYVDSGPSGTISDIDFSRRIIELSNVTDRISFITEHNIPLVSENGIQLNDQTSNGISNGDVLIGASSHAQATITWNSRANGVAEIGGVGLTKKKTTNSIGILNSPDSKIHDGKRIQDYSYVVRTGTSLYQYKQVLIDTVHPAGYDLYGDVIHYHYTSGHPVSTPYSFGIKGAESSFTTTVNIKTAFVNTNILRNKNLWYYNATLASWYTTETAMFADYTFDNYDYTGSSFISDHVPLTANEPYVAKSVYSSASTIQNSAIISSMTDTSAINIGYRIIGWDVHGYDIFQENKVKLEDSTFLLWEDYATNTSGNLVTDEPMVTIATIPNLTTITASKNAKATQSVTVAVQNIPSLYLN